MVNAAAPTQATVVIGGGFGGISAIQALRHRHPEIPVILVNQGTLCLSTVVVRAAQW